jgi:uncharacterized protein (DUF58 family)
LPSWKSASGVFTSAARTKNEIAAELCALLSFSAIKNNDSVGLIVFTDAVEFFIPPKRGTRHVLRLIREMLSFNPARRGTDIAGALKYLGRVLPRKAVAFLVSDFLCGGFERELQIMNRRHDIVAIRISDPRELELPKVGLLELKDAETGVYFLVDTGSESVRSAFERGAKERINGLHEVFRSSGVDCIDIRTDQDYVPHIVRFFLERERRLRS